MIYLSSFTFPDEDYEWRYRLEIRRTSYSSVYPFYVFPEKGLRQVFFEPITIFYGGNGSGKSTALNVIAEKLRLKRETPFNRSPFFEDYVDACACELEEAIPSESRIVTSDDVFDFMLNLRAVSEGVDNEREELMKSYHELKKEKFRLRSMEDYEHLRSVTEARRKTESRFTRDNLSAPPREHSNGESAKLYFEDKIQDDTLCLLDEPENSLSPQNQRLLADYLADSVRYCGVQLIIATHSPFLLSLPGARIVNLDEGSRTGERWTELAGVRAYYDFFKENEKLF